MSSATHPAPTAALGRDMAAAIREGLATLRRVMADPDPKLAIKGVAELTKLLGVCARCKLLKIRLDEPVDRVESAWPNTAQLTPLPASALPTPTSPARGEVRS